MPTTLPMMLFFVLAPSKMWYAPDQPIQINIQGQDNYSLVLTTFTGKRVDAEASADVEAGKSVDLRTIYKKALSIPDTYVLYAVPKGQPLEKFAGTPLVIEGREDRRQPGPLLVTRVEPLRYAQMTTDKGPVTMVFYYDVAPVTADNFLSLAAQGYYDGLTFHRIVPGFVIQGGDPQGTGGGGPGYQIVGEFNDRPHEEGVLSMARLGDPQEGPGVMPRPQYANSAGSQFFVCLNYENTKALDRRYTAFGKVVAGMDAVKAIAAVKLVDPQAGKPEKPPEIKKVEVKPVTAQDNPYKAIMDLSKQ